MPRPLFFASRETRSSSLHKEFSLPPQAVDRRTLYPQFRDETDSGDLSGRTRVDSEFRLLSCLRHACCIIGSTPPYPEQRGRHSDQRVGAFEKVAKSGREDRAGTESWSCRTHEKTPDLRCFNASHRPAEHGSAGGVEWSSVRFAEVCARQTSAAVKVNCSKMVVAKRYSCIEMLQSMRVARR